jgi:tRNA threonylcarbamoyladenosine biosynthesis protein TsaB
MNILAIDTSTHYLVLAIVLDGRVVFAKEILAQRVLENSIVMMMDHALKDISITLEQVDVFAIGLGPGSFTSLRVGLETIKAFAMASGKKVVGLSSLDIMARHYLHQQGVDQVAVMMDARRDSVYHCLYDINGNRITQESLSLLDDFLKTVKGKTLFVGDALLKYRDRIELAYTKFGSATCQAIFPSENIEYPQAKDLAQAAMVKCKQGTMDDPRRILPVYLYPAACQVTKAII